MKRWIAGILIPFCLLGCSRSNSSMDKLLSFRENLLQSSKISFVADITADYGDDYYTFQMQCESNPEGNIIFKVLQPDSICGIEGQISQNEGHITFSDQVLLFKPGAEDRLSPIVAPWLLLETLCGGYITACGNTENGYLAVIRDSYNENALTIEVEFVENTPTYAEIFWNQTRIISIQIHNFQYVA